MSEWSLGKFRIQDAKIEIDRNPHEFFPFNDHQRRGEYKVKITFWAPDVDTGCLGPVTTECFYPDYMPEERAVLDSLKRILNHEVDEWLRKPGGERYRDPHPERLQRPGVTDPSAPQDLGGAPERTP